MFNVVILDGYSDEPAGLGVPPYLDIYPRYVAGAIKHVSRSAKIYYFTIDYVRKNLDTFLKVSSKSKLLIFLCGVSVPGKYIGGEPIKIDEIKLLSRLIKGPIKILGGPAARFGFGIEGGRIAESSTIFSEDFDLIVKGDVELVVYNFIKEGFSIEKVDPNIVRENYDLTSIFAVKGAFIVKMHPNYGLNLICEIETYRGCPRYVVGGCSFCIEPLYGKVIYRPIEDVLREIETLYSFGVRNFRIGRQADLYTYMAKDTGRMEFPKPNVRAIKRLFEGIRKVAPELDVLHIDNVNPGTIYHYPKESIKISKIIIENHTPGDVAAYGIESADPRVIKANNLKVYPDEAFEAIKILNKVGGTRGWNGMPELLPGLNFVYGLIGESKETYILNYEFLKKVLDEGLMVRRINIRQVLPLPGTRMWRIGVRIIRKHRGIFKYYKEKIRREIDLPMLRRVIPKKTILKRAMTEKYVGNRTYARQVGSYPILIDIPMKLELNKYIDVFVINHGFRSIQALPYPIKINKLSLKCIKMLPIDSNTIIKIIINRPFKNSEDFRKKIGRIDLIEHLDFT